MTIHYKGLCRKLLFLLFLMFSVSGNGANAADNKSSNRLRILTYNIKMLPRIIRRTHHYPIIRARIIPDYILAEDADIVVFEEAFDAKADKILRKNLKQRYPYMIGPLNKKPGFKINGGVMILSKYPIKQISTIQYSKCTDEDCWARKGVLLVEVNDGHRVYQLAGTHMNGGGSLEMKTTQYHEMGELVKQYAKPGVPQFLVGDYNTSNMNKDFYGAMIKQLEAMDGPISGQLQCTNDHLNNDMQPYFDVKERDIIDYILYRPNGVQPKSITRVIHQYCNHWRKDHDDLSDHYALLMELEW